MSRRVFLVIGVAVPLALLAVLAWLLADTLRVRYTRDVSRMVFNDNLQLLRELRRQAGLGSDSVARTEPGPRGSRPYVVVSIEDHRLWYRSGDTVLYTAPVGTGSGRILERSGGDTHWRFETPRGRLTVISKDTAPIWVPPDWHYVEEAQRRGLGVVRLSRGQRLPIGDGRALTVRGSDLVIEGPGGSRIPLATGQGQEPAFAGNIVIPPFGTNQRKYPGVLGTHRLNLGNGYAIHGTNQPETVGRSVSHGCVRLLNADIAALYALVPVGTPVYIY